ncbi:HPr kinase/phosphatase C-terminal domain-containing protein [Agrobacterium vitis]|uniref:HPr kinase/phosphorylase n=1 Tax=Agrobacterium vitis TaxID=373 RepID=UPI0012E92B01|nr:HPr kinase/phosphatase C-terminal domain-containing protein [Agrobacterium vitis]MVA24374.1 HPr kinase/phosphorylase [Agrobacterium vitis]
MNDSRLNLHATGIVLGRRGYLIMGPSGSGKSQLARLLLENARQNGLFAALVADDRVWLEARGGRVVASRPQTIAGLMEIRFSGLVTVPSLDAAVIDAVILSVEPSSMTERLPQCAESRCFFPDLCLPVLRLCPAHHPSVAGLQRLLEAWATD